MQYMRGYLDILGKDNYPKDITRRAFVERIRRKVKRNKDKRPIVNVLSTYIKKDSEKIEIQEKLKNFDKSLEMLQDFAKDLTPLEKKYLKLMI